MIKNFPKSIIKIGILVFFLAGLWFSGEILNTIASKDAASSVGYIIKYEGVVYFIKEEKLKQSDLKKILNTDFSTTLKFEPVSILSGAEFKIPFKGIKNGDKVKIWYKSILESYPPKINVIQIRKIN
ncbi:DUF3221 domain-containing protein [Bacillus sp. JJ1773]|uniref:DUF3221 domain-containing protein n=1 Tax=Bacillus sp. JJ1773 TaxID=3122965 RepID=UPI002FFFF103